MFEIIGSKSSRPAPAVVPESGRPRRGFFDSLAFYGMLATVVLFAIPYGTVTAWHKSGLVLTVCLFAAFRLAGGLTSRSFRFADGTVLLLPLLGILGLPLVQIIRWPGASTTISVDPYETKSFILLFVALLVFFEILYFYSETLAELQTLVLVVLIVGVGSAVFGISRDVFIDGTELLAGYLRPDQGSFAQFINRNHFAVLMEMSFGMVLGLLIKGEFSERIKFVGWVISGILIYAIITANSRGGLVSFAGLVLFAVFVHMITKASERGSQKPRRFNLAKVVTATGLCVLLFGLIAVTIAFVGGDTVVTRIERIRGEVETVQSTSVNRHAIWNSTIELIKDNPIAGVGFGAYAAAITRYDTSGGRLAVQQAHNDYLEILANGGIIGFALFAAFAVQVARRIKENLGSLDPFRHASCFGAVIGIVGVLIHSFVDFGLHTVINALVFAILIVIATARIRSRPERELARHAHPRKEVLTL